MGSRRVRICVRIGSRRHYIEFTLSELGLDSHFLSYEADPISDILAMAESLFWY